MSRGLRSVTIWRHGMTENNGIITRAGGPRPRRRPDVAATLLDVPAQYARQYLFAGVTGTALRGASKMAVSTSLSCSAVCQITFTQSRRSPDERVAVCADVRKL